VSKTGKIRFGRNHDLALGVSMQRCVPLLTRSVAILSALRRRATTVRSVCAPRRSPGLILGFLLPLFAMLLALQSSPGSAQRPAAIFSVSGSRILKNGSEFVIHGVSVNGPGSPGKRPTVQDVDAIVNLWKFNLVRVGCSIKPRSAAKEVNDLDEIVRAFTARGVVVLIDPRDHVGGYYQDPPKPAGTPALADLLTWYEAVGVRWRDNPLVWFEVMSGPGIRDDRRDMEIWRDTHERVVDALRNKAAATNIIVCEGRGQGDETSNNGALPVSEAASAILTNGPILSRKFPNLLYAFHIDELWNGGAEKIDDFLDRIREHGLPVFISEYGNTRWADSTPAVEAMLAVCRPRNVGRCVWNWAPTDSQHLCAPDNMGGGWQIDTLDGSKPSNLSWLGDRVWDDNHSRVPLHGALLDRGSWTATAFASPSEQGGRYNQPDAILSPYTTSEDYWSSNKAQEPGQWFQIDMGAKRTFSRLMVDTRARYADYPRGYEVYVSNDGLNWGSPIAKGKNDQSVLRLTFPNQSARYIKLVQTGKTWHHWVVANFEVYAPLGTTLSASAKSAREPDKAIEPRAWSVIAGPNRWYQAELPLRPLRDENQVTANGRQQQPGDYYQVDMGEPQRFHKVVLNCGRSLSDYPRGYELFVSSDGVDWGKPIATGRGAPVTAIVFPTQTARYLKLVLTRHTRNYWAIAEFRVYGPPPGGIPAARR